MRETLLIENMSAEDILAFSSIEAKKHVLNIRKQKIKGLRPKPSTCLIDKSNLLDKLKRSMILDKIANLVDENLFGRSEMCIQFADLLQRTLVYLQIDAKPIIGKAIYYLDRKEIFQWEHAWVQTDNEIIDGNIDSTFENPFVPKELNLKPYWGSVANIPNDRKFQKDSSLVFPYDDDDVKNIWWPELKNWLNKNVK